MKLGVGLDGAWGWGWWAPTSNMGILVGRFLWQAGLRTFFWCALKVSLRLEHLSAWMIMLWLKNSQVIEPCEGISCFVDVT